MPETISISISEFKATCLKVIDQVKNTGNSVIVTKRGKPYALVTKPPAPTKKESWTGKYKGKIEIIGHPSYQHKSSLHFFGEIPFK